MKIRIHLIWRACVCWIALAALCGPVFAAGPRVERVEGYKASKHAVAAIRDALDSGDVAAVAEPAQAMAAFAEKLASLYPPPVAGEFVSASMEAILANFPDFERKAEAFAASARDLSELAGSGAADPVRLRESLGRVRGACVACHRAYLGR